MIINELPALHGIQNGSGTFLTENGIHVYEIRGAEIFSPWAETGERNREFTHRPGDWQSSVMSSAGWGRAVSNRMGFRERIREIFRDTNIP